MLIPDRSLTEWSRVEGTKTTFADPVVRLGLRLEHEVQFSDLFIAYPVASLPSRSCVRIDFLAVLCEKFSSGFLSPHDGGLPALEVVDRSRFKEEVLADAVFKKFFRGDHEFVASDEVFRHFRITFGNYGRFDILARSAHVRRFDCDHGEFEDHLERHNSLLNEALAIGPVRIWS